MCRFAISTFSLSKIESKSSLSLKQNKNESENKNHTIHFALLVSNVAFPQLKQITAAEYFWDIDPGVGNATPLNASGGSFTKSIEIAVLNTSSLPATGNHVFNVRFKDTYNHWSPLFKTVIVLLPNINIPKNY